LDYLCNRLKTNNTILVKVLGRKLAIVGLIAISAAASFATLGDGRIKKDKPSKSLLTNKTQTNSFTLRSGYTFRGNEVINTQTPRYINLNTTLTYQRGNTTYVLPLKKKVLIDNVKIELGNRQLRRN
jgi:hypothetical protein